MQMRAARGNELYSPPPSENDESQPADGGRVVAAALRHVTDKVNLVSTLPSSLSHEEASQYLGLYTKGFLSSPPPIKGARSFRDSTYQPQGYYEKGGDPSKMVWWDGEVWVVGSKHNLSRRIGVLCVEDPEVTGSDISPQDFDCRYLYVIEQPRTSIPPAYSGSRADGATPTSAPTGTVAPGEQPDNTSPSSASTSAPKAYSPNRPTAAPGGVAGATRAMPGAGKRGSAAPSTARYSTEPARQMVAGGGSTEQLRSASPSGLAPPADEARRAQLEERVSRARVSADAALERRVQELLKQAFEEWTCDQIDTAELARRKSAAQAAVSEHRWSSTLDAAYNAYMGAARARDSAFEVYSQAAEEEAKKEQEVYKALDELDNAGF